MAKISWMEMAQTLESAEKDGALTVTNLLPNGEYQNGDSSRKKLIL